MKVLRIIASLGILGLTSLCALAQETTASIAGRAIVPMEVRGFNPEDPSDRSKVSVIDIPAMEAAVILIAGKDTLRETVNMAGSFKFTNLKPGSVHLTITYQDYEPFSEGFELTPGENVVMVAFTRKTEMLDAAVKKENKPVVTQHGDTLVYHAAAVAIQNGDYAVDLLRRFPGVEVKNGEIIVTGKAVKRSYVNGALIFGLDPMASMENLKADQVVSMNVYDEDNPSDKLDGVVREKDRVINIKTKDPIFSTTDLQFRAIAGMDQQLKENGKPQLRYTAGGNMHFFSELKQLSADVATGNLGMHSSSINMTPGPLSTYVDNTDLKLGFNRYWESPLFGNALQLSYSFGREKTRSRRRSLAEYFETAGTPERMIDNESISENLVRRHGIQTAYAYRTGKHFIITWHQDLSIAKNLSSQDVKEENTIANATTMLRSQEASSTHRSWDLRENVSLGFRSPGKMLPTIELKMQVGQNQLDSWDLDTLASSYSQRWLTKEGRGLSQQYSARISQGIINRHKKNPDNPRMGSSSQLIAEYNLSYTAQNKQQEAYDLWNTPSPVLNPANTFDFTYSSLLNSLQLSYTYIRSNPNAPFHMRAVLAAEAERIIDQERVPALQSGKNVFYRLRPTFTVTYKGISLTLNSSARTPSVEQLRRRIDDTNPLSLIAGNPSLKQSFVYSINLGKSSVNRASNHMLTWTVQAQVETQPIVRRSVFYSADTVLEEYDNYEVKAGSTLLRSENADYAWNTNGNISLMSQWGGPWSFATTFRPALSFRNMPQYFGMTLDRTSELTPSLLASGSFFPGTKAVMISFTGDVAYIRAWNQEGSMDTRALRTSAGVQIKASFLKRAFFNADYHCNLYNDFIHLDMSNTVNRLNLSLGVNLLKDQSLKVALSGIDLLRGGTQYSVAVGPSSLVRTWTPVYGRYFLIDISYRFNNSGGKRMMTYSF